VEEIARFEVEVSRRKKEKLKVPKALVDLIMRRSSTVMALTQDCEAFFIP
jgi:hypothetical protein